MSLPFTTNRVTIEEADDSGDKWETRSYVTTYTNVPCVIGNTASRSVQSGAGQQEATDLKLFLNRDIEVTSGARVTDEDGGEVYLVEWVQDRTGLNLDRRECGLRLVVGVSG